MVILAGSMALFINISKYQPSNDMSSRSDKHARFMHTNRGFISDSDDIRIIEGGD